MAHFRFALLCMALFGHLFWWLSFKWTRQMEILNYWRLYRQSQDPLEINTGSKNVSFFQIHQII